MTEITLLCSKFSDVCHDILSQVSMTKLQEHMKIIWVDRQEYRDILSETEISTVPCIIVIKNGNRVVYQGDSFTNYWNEFVRSLTRKKPNVLNKMHSKTMMHVDKINQSILKMNQSIQSNIERKSLLSEQEFTDGLHDKLLHSMNHYQHQPTFRPFQLNNQLNHIKEQSELGNLRHEIETQHKTFKAAQLALQNAQEIHKSPFNQLKMANSSLQQTPPL